MHGFSRHTHMCILLPHFPLDGSDFGFGVPWMCVDALVMCGVMVSDIHVPSSEDTTTIHHFSISSHLTFVPFPSLFRSTHLSITISIPPSCITRTHTSL